MKPQEYQAPRKENQPPRAIGKNVFLAFLVGGAISAVGQLVLEFVSGVERTTDEAAAVTLAIMILLGSVLTGLGVYDKIAEKEALGCAHHRFSNTVTAAPWSFAGKGSSWEWGRRCLSLQGPS